MTALLGGIAVDTAQADNIFFRAKNTRNNNRMKGNLLDCQRIQEPTSDVLQKLTRTRDQIRNAATHGGVYRIIRIEAYVEQVAFPMFCFLTVSHGADAICESGREVHFLQVGKTITVGVHATNTMLVAEIKDGLLNHRGRHNNFLSGFLHDFTFLLYIHGRNDLGMAETDNKQHEDKNAYQLQENLLL